MLKGIVAAVVVMAAVAGAPSASAGPVGGAPSGTVCDGRWHIRPSALAPPERPGQEDLDVLDAVAAVSPADQWAVGSWEQYPKAYAFHTLAEHFTGTRWRHVHSPDPGPPADSSLYGIAAITASDVWAVGGPTVIQPYHSLVAHWDGTSWSIARGASFPGVLYGVAAAGPRDIWAVGTLNFPGPGLIEHWNGSRWAVIASPNPGADPNGNALWGVTAVSAHDAWAVGSIGGAVDPYPTTKPLIARWNGAAWSRIPAPGTGQLLAVAAERSGSGVSAAGVFTAHPAYLGPLTEYRCPASR